MVRDPDLCPSKGLSVVNPDDRLGHIGENTEQDDRSSDGEIINVYPDGGLKAWSVFLGVFIMNFVVWGGNMALAYYLAHYISDERSPLKGLRRSVVSLISAGSLSALLFVSPISNIIENYVGIRKCMTLGAILCAVGFFAAPYSKNVYWLITWQAVVAGLGRGMISMPVSYIVGKWFDKKCSLVMGLCQAGAGSGAILFHWISYQTLECYGLEWSFHINNAVSTVLIIPCILLAKDRSPCIYSKTGKPVETKPSKALTFAPLKSKLVLVLMVRCFFSQWAYTVTRSILNTYANEALKMDYTEGFYMQVFASTGLVIGRPVIGLFADRIGVFRAAIIIESIGFLSHYLLWLPASNPYMMYALSLVEGCVGGIFFLTSVPIVMKISHADNMRNIITHVWLITAVSSLFSMPISLHLVDLLTRSNMEVLKAYRILVIFDSVFVLIAILLSVYLYYLYKKKNKFTEVSK